MCMCVMLKCDSALVCWRDEGYENKTENGIRPDIFLIIEITVDGANGKNILNDEKYYNESFYSKRLRTDVENVLNNNIIISTNRVNK